MSTPASRTHSVELCMITTPDGAIDVSGRSGPLGGPPDQAHLKALRARASAVLVGAGTARAEKYGPPSQPGLQIVVVTNSAKLDYSSALFTSGAGIIATHHAAPTVPVQSLRAGSDTVDLRGIIQQLPPGIVHVEGGPMLNAALLDADLVNAINLTFAPRLVGARGASLSQPPHALRAFVQKSLHIQDDFVFVRYERQA